MSSGPLDFAHLHPLLAGGDVQGLVAVLAGRPEAQRRTVAGDVLAWCTGGQTGEQAQARVHASGEVGLVALLGCASLRELATLRPEWFDGAYGDAAYQVLADRRPRWLDAWVQQVLEADGSFAHPWGLCRRLVRDGVAARPRSDWYVRRMITAGFDGRAARQLLGADGGLLDWEVWRLFDVEGRPGCNLADHGRGWADALVALAEDGTVPRERLLDATLDALARGFSDHNAGWYRDLHDRLAPTLAETAPRIERYLLLLHADIPATVRLSLRVLGRLAEVDRLPAGPLAAHLDAVLTAGSPGVATAGLDLLDRALTTDAGARERGLRAATAALAHPRTDVQRRALGVITAHLQPGHDVDLAAAETRIAAVLRPRLHALLADLATTARTSAGDLRQTAEELPADLRALAGVDDALAALDDGVVAAPWSWDPTGAPLLGEPTRLAGVGDVDELVWLLEILVESCDSADDLERGLDGISRLCDRDPADLSTRTGALRAQAAAVLGDAGICRAFLSGEPHVDICGVVLAWLDADPPGDGPPVTRTVGAFLSRRAREVAQRAARRIPRVLLAAPTHRGGWIQASVLADRLAALHASGARPDPADAVQAILRLHPTGRDQALQRLGTIDDEVAQAVGYALGEPAVMAGPTAALWQAAAAVRSADGRDALVARSHPNLARDVVFLSELAATDPPRPANGPRHNGGYTDGVSPSLQPTVARWAATIRPGRLDWLFTKACEALHHWRDATTAGLAVLVEPVLDPDVAFAEAGARMLMLAMATTDPACRRLATDALHATIADGRLDASGLAEALACLLLAGAVSPARVAPALGEVAGSSPLHAETIRLAVGAALHGGSGNGSRGASGGVPADVHPLLALLGEPADAQAGASVRNRQIAVATVHARVQRARRWSANTTADPATSAPRCRPPDSADLDTPRELIR